MNKILLVIIGTGILLTSCGSRTDQSSVSTHAGADTMNHSNTKAQSHDHQDYDSSSMMGIMDKSMNDMKALKSRGNADVDFAATMKLHHMSAVEASRLVLQKGTDAEIRNMAQKMIDDQQREINEFDNYLNTNTSSGTDTAFFTRSMAEMNEMNMSMDHSGSIEKQFVVMMIPHHQGAVEMSELYLKSARDAKLKRMATNIISSQEKEIGQLKAWLAKQK